jgi:hypothetical protein
MCPGHSVLIYFTVLVTFAEEWKLQTFLFCRFLQLSYDTLLNLKVAMLNTFKWIGNSKDHCIVILCNLDPCLPVSAVQHPRMQIS